MEYYSQSVITVSQCHLYKNQKRWNALVTLTLFLICLQATSLFYDFSQLPSTPQKKYAVFFYPNVYSPKKLKAKINRKNRRMSENSKTTHFVALSQRHLKQHVCKFTGHRMRCWNRMKRFGLQNMLAFQFHIQSITSRSVFTILVLSSSSPHF